MYCEIHAELAAAEGQPITREQMKGMSRKVIPTELETIFGMPGMGFLLTAMEKSNAENLSFADTLEFRCNKNPGPRKNAVAQPSAKKSDKSSMSAAVVSPKSSPRSREYVFVTRPCGQIEQAVPIYRAESPSQVFLLVLASVFLHVIRNNIPAADWGKIFVIYDNACNLNRIHAAQQPLPLPAPYDRLWLLINKVIDVFHLYNYKRPECKTTYNPNNIRKVHPDLEKRNTEGAEQTFSWVERFKAVLNSVPRNRQIFYIFRLIKHRNAYLASRHSS